jgi:hypothetical protein
MIDKLGLVICWQCIAQAFLSLFADAAAVFAMGRPGVRAAAGKLITRSLGAKLGVCKKCMVLCVLLLAASIWVLLAAMRSSQDIRLIAGLSVVMGLLLGLTVAHFVVRIWRSSMIKGGNPLGLPLAEAPRRKCCGG